VYAYIILSFISLSTIILADPTSFDLATFGVTGRRSPD
jgi:hypothetical protein